jgi:DNA-nicking Smr family endonuclease
MKKPPVHRSSRSRHLSPDEIQLWLEATRAVKPRSSRQHLDAPRSVSPAIAMAPDTGLLSSDRDKSVPPLPPPLVPLERRLKQRLHRGQADVQGVVDLHGMRQAEAHRALLVFLRQAQINGARVVLVITGKGSAKGGAVDMLGQEGVLRRSVPQWLRASELRSVVIGFEQAGIAHGGTGALYVRIRRAG